jgi:hypothetical protein
MLGCSTVGDETLVADLYDAIPKVELLRTVPGIGWVLAYTIAAKLGDIRRFSSPRRIAVRRQEWDVQPDRLGWLTALQTGPIAGGGIQGGPYPVPATRPAHGNDTHNGPRIQRDLHRSSALILNALGE